MPWRLTKRPAMSPAMAPEPAPRMNSETTPCQRSTGSIPLGSTRSVIPASGGRLSGRVGGMLAFGGPACEDDWRDCPEGSGHLRQEDVPCMPVQQLWVGALQRV